MADSAFRINRGVTLNPQSAAPSNPTNGDIYYDSTTNTFVHYNNGAWQNLSSRVDIATAASLTSSTFTSAVVQNSIIKLTGSIDTDLHGMAANSDGKQTIVYNSSSTAVITIKANSVTEATAANRIVTPTTGDVVLGIGSAAIFIYDSTQARWVLLSISGGSGDTVQLDVILRDRFVVNDFEFLGENLFSTDKSTKVDTTTSGPPNLISTGSYSFAKSSWLLSSIGQTMVSYNHLDPLFLAEGIDVTDVELYLQWLSGFVDTAATYEVSRDGGNNWTNITSSMSAIGSQNYRGYITFADESVQTSLQTYANSNSDTNSSLTGSGANQARAQKFTVSNTEVLRSMDIYLNKVQTSGTVAGKYKISIVKDSAGSPSVAAQDNISESDLLNASALSVGLNTVTVTMPQVVMVPGDYWIVFSTDADYKASYSAAVRSIDVRSDTSPFGTGTPASAYTFDGTTWTASAGPIALVYLLKGRVHDLRVRVTSGTATKYIEGYGIYYGLQSGVTSASGEKSLQRFYFTGDSNTTDFTLNFTPDPDLLEIIDPYRGQCYAIEEGVARIIGQVVRFEPNTFNFPGENIVLIFRQVKGSTIDNSNANAANISSIQSNLIDVGNQLADTQRVAVPLLTVPNTTIINRAQIPDPSQDLRARLGIDRIMTQQIYQLQNEFGPNGEPVWGMINDDRGLQRYVGNWLSLNDIHGQRTQAQSVGDYCEITFYGTGLNMLTFTAADTRQGVASVDGGADGAGIYPGATGSAVLDNRNYSANLIFPVVSGLTLGVHTVKIKMTVLTVQMLGFEILNENKIVTTGNTSTSVTITGIPSTSQLAIGMTVSGSGVPAGATISSVDSSTQVTISAATTSSLTGTALTFAGSLNINPGITYNAGKKLTLASAQVQSYRAGFETGTLGTKGGRVLVYQKSDGTVAKAVQPADVSQLLLTSASHANEEVIRTYHFREFGAGRYNATYANEDDFSLLEATARNAAFTLDDGTTSLVGSSVGVTGNTASVYMTTNGSFLTFTFVGTGLDIIRADTNSGGGDTFTYSIDGSTPATLSSTGLGTNKRQQKIVSGLPYGTHTVKIARSSAVSAYDLSISQYIVYGPKKPTLPSGAVELADYNIMADYSIGNATDATTAGGHILPTGTLFKGAARENVYIGANWTMPAVDVNGPGGFAPLITTNNSQPHQYTFWGTGFILLEGTSGATYDVTVTVDGSLNASGVARSNATNLTGGSYRMATGGAVGVSRVEFTGLSLGVHTISISRSAGTGNMSTYGIAVITPIHSPKSNIYADLQNTLTVGSCGISDNRPTKTIKELTTLPSKFRAQCQQLTLNPTTSVNAWVAMPDMSLTVKSNGAWFDMSFFASCYQNTASLYTMAQIYVNGVAVGQPAMFNTGPTVNIFTMLHQRHLSYLSAGVHKVDVYWNPGGAGTMGTDRRELTVVEI